MAKYLPIALALLVNASFMLSPQLRAWAAPHLTLMLVLNSLAKILLNLQTPPTAQELPKDAQ